ncbi:uncharacterized protein A1O9_11954, partial [Exophiala aquamarina CBS 119918]
IGLVIDNVIYDCSQFVKEHPGGEAVIRRYAAKDCSLQFWKFHRECHLVKYGPVLQVGQVVVKVDKADPPPNLPPIIYSNSTFEYDDDW